MPRHFKVKNLLGFNRHQIGPVSRLILAPIIELGHINPDRWRRMYELLKQSKAITGSFDPGALIFNPELLERQRQEQLIKQILYGFTAILLIAVLAGGLLLFKHNKELWQAEQTLRDSDERFRDISTTASDRFWEMDENLRFTTFVEYTGSKTLPVLEYLIGHTRWEAAGADPDNDDTWRRHRADHLARRAYRDFQYSLTGENGIIRHLSISGNPVFDSTGAFKGYRGSATDITESKQTEDELLKAYEGLEKRIEHRTRDLLLEITERKRAEEALRQGEQRLNAIVNTAAEGIITIDSEGVIQSFNAASERMFGYPAGEVLGKNVKMIMPATQADMHDGFLSNYRSTGDAKIIGIRRELEGLHMDGSIFPLELSISETILDNRHMFTGIVHDNTERKRVEEVLLAARDQADAANLAKSEFLSSMSHELRTPLNAILGFGQLLEQNPKDPLNSSQLEHTQQILKGGQHLLKLINEVLELAQIEAGKIALAKVNVNPVTIFAECLDLTRTLADESGIELMDRTGDQIPPRVLCDPIRFKQVLINLLSNAVKYNRKGGGVTLACRETDDGMLRVEVADTGPGIPAEMHGELFQPFCRLGKEASDVEGSGIGLTITKQLVHLMDGHIDFESKLGMGSTFWFELPLVGESVPETDADEAHERPPRTWDYRFLDRPINLLYVEDNLANQRLMAELFARYPNVDLLCTQTAEEGLMAAAANRTDMIIMDINLPGMSGIEALGVLRRSKKTRAIPVIALSASAMPGEVKKGLEAGFLNYLTKPIVIDEVLSAIDDALVDA